MFGLGFTEILVLAVLGLILLGPDQLPEVARTLGRFFSDLKKSTDELTDEFKKNSFDSQNLIEDIRKDFNSAGEAQPETGTPVDHTEHSNSHTHTHTHAHDHDHVDEPVQLEMDTDYDLIPHLEEEKNGKKPESK
jgi:sec-independent protein translocase protein TatB